MIVIAEKLSALHTLLGVFKSVLESGARQPRDHASRLERRRRAGRVQALEPQVGGLLAVAIVHRLAHEHGGRVRRQLDPVAGMLAGAEGELEGCYRDGVNDSENRGVGGTSNT